MSTASKGPSGHRRQLAVLRLVTLPDLFRLYVGLSHSKFQGYEYLSTPPPYSAGLSGYGKCLVHKDAWGLS